MRIISWRFFRSQQFYIHSQQISDIGLIVIVISNHQIKHSEKVAEINIKSMEDMTMNNSKKETISTSKKIICVVTVIIAIAAAFGLIYGIVRANSMIIFQASSLAAIDTVTICLNSRNIKKEREAKKNEVIE